MDEYDPDTLSKDEAFQQAQKERRRILVRILLDEDSEHAVEDLATEVVAREQDVAAEAVPHDEHEQAYVSLIHRDLPKLAEDDVVAFDPETEIVAPGANIADLDPLV